MAAPKTNLFDRLFERAIICESGCWEYSGHRNQDGYGMIWSVNRMQLAHRMAYDLCIADIPIGLKVLHTCDNPPCVNPAHLWIGTDQDNTNDKMAKGRQGFLCGSQLSHSKLTESDVIEIRELIAEKCYGQRDIARLFNVSQRAISAINTRKFWKHVE